MYNCQSNLCSSQWVVVKLEYNKSPSLICSVLHSDYSYSEPLMPYLYYAMCFTVHIISIHFDKHSSDLGRDTCLAPEEFMRSISGPWPKKLCATGVDCDLVVSCLLDSVVEHGLDWSCLTRRGRHPKNERVLRRSEILLAGHHRDYITEPGCMTAGLKIMDHPIIIVDMIGQLKRFHFLNECLVFHAIECLREVHCEPNHIFFVLQQVGNFLQQINESRNRRTSEAECVPALDQFSHAGQTNSRVMVAFDHQSPQDPREYQNHQN